MSGDGLIELVDRDEALRMDAELVQMACSQSVVRLSIGEGFAGLGKRWQELGFSTFEGYVRERCARTGRWGEDTRALAARLMGLPQIRRRLMSGAIGWCMAEVLARVATAEDEEELLEATRGMTVRQVKRALRERGGKQAEPEEEEVRFGTLELSVSLEEAWGLEATRPMIEVLDGHCEPGAWFESLLAEGQGWFTNVAPDAEPLPDDVVARQNEWLARIAEGERRLDRKEALAEAALPPMPEVSLRPMEAMPLGALAIDRVLARELGPRLASCDLQFGRLLSRFFAVRAWRVLGFASEKQYARERLGMSRSAVCARIALARRATHLERIGEALHAGDIGYEAATLIARVATPDTEAQWVERARVRTFKHLREEVQAVEMITRMMREDDPPGPPADEEIAIVQALRRDMRSGAYARRAFGIEREDDAPADIEEAGASAPYVEMARSARAVEEALRAVIDRAGERAASMTPEQAEAACTGLIEASDGAEPVIDLEADVTSSPAVQMFGNEPSADPSGESGAGSVERSETHQGAVQMFGSDVFGSDEPTLAADAPVQMFGTCESEPDDAVVQLSESERRAVHRAWGKVVVRVRVREDVILHYRQLEAAFQRAGLGGSFAMFLVIGFWTSWAEVLGRTNACEQIARRDLYECTCPVCGRPCGPSHHIKRRSRGGGDEATNLTSPCEWCHLEALHGGRMGVRGKAPDLVWLIGRTPIMEVHGRERRLLA